VTLVTAGYFAYLAVLALFSRACTVHRPRGVPAGRKAKVMLVSTGAAIAIAVFGMPHVMPLVYLLVGYWLPALLVRDPNRQLERWLLDFDNRLFGTGGLEQFEKRAPRVMVEYLELAYLLCYAVVPAGFAWLVLAGFADQAGRFWSNVLLAAVVCYGLLPWRPTRAPRALERDRGGWRSAVRRLNLAVLGRASVQWNTFPSGHTAASLATALAVGSVVPVAGVVFGIVALSIAAGSVAGRYHYAADAIAGALVAILAFVMATAAHAP
jgi:membrane-associated phospholipid phosphatase